MGAIGTGGGGGGGGEGEGWSAFARVLGIEYWTGIRAATVGDGVTVGVLSA
jgi:hypothetical protein